MKAAPLAMMVFLVETACASVGNRGYIRRDIRYTCTAA